MRRGGERRMKEGGSKVENREKVRKRKNEKTGER